LAEGGPLFLNLAGPAEAQALNPATRTTVRQLAHLPWELLHDGTQFLAAHGVVPVRVMTSRAAAADKPANRPLRLLFMATSPEDVQPVLDFEREESAILEATAKQPIDLVVEESGSVGQLENVVDSFGRGEFDVFHLTGHGTIENGAPYFLVEDDFGRPATATATQLAKAFGNRWPDLVFLSGCHTGQAPDRGMVPSMAHAMVEAGARAVLGWARPVYDTTGIIAAGKLYHSLATGDSTLEAIADTRREMLESYLAQPMFVTCSDWHLLRIYQSAAEAPPLVLPLKMRKGAKPKPRPAETEFLDAEGKVKVAAAARSSAVSAPWPTPAIITACSCTAWGDPARAPSRRACAAAMKR